MSRELLWKGPFRFVNSETTDGNPDHIEGPGYDEISSSNGVYALAIKTRKGLAINYVGSTYKGDGFGQRLMQHLHDYMSYQYQQLDFEDLMNGIQTPINVGWLNMLYAMQVRAIQESCLPPSTVEKIREGYRFGINQRKSLLEEMINHPIHGNVCKEDESSFQEIKRMFETGVSIDSFVKDKKVNEDIRKYCRKINNNLKKVYIERFDRAKARQFGVAKCREMRIYVSPMENEIRNTERIIHTSICHHPIQWVREFIAYHLTSADSLGSSRYPLEFLADRMGIDYTGSADLSEPSFNGTE